MTGDHTLEDGFLQSSFEQAHHIGETIGPYWHKNKAPPQMMYIPTMPETPASVR